MTEPPVPRELRRLTALRALAALAVLLFHVDLRGGTTGALAPVTHYGFTGVTFFFVLSGFVLTWSWRPGPLAFYRRRFARIYPSHLAVLLAALVVPVTVTPVSWGDVIPNLALVQAWWPWALNPYSLNGVAWSLSCEVAFYLTLPVVLPWLARRSRGTRWAAAGSWWGVASVTVLWSAWAGEAQRVLTVWPPVRFGEFLLGVVAGMEVRAGARLGTRPAALLAGAGLAVLLLGPSAVPGPNVGAALVAVAVIVVAAQRDIDGRDGELLGHRWLVYGGRLSYALYLVHELVMLNLGHALPLGPVAVTPVLVAGSLLAAVALHHVVEVPCERRLRGSTTDRVPRPALS